MILFEGIPVADTFVLIKEITQGMSGEKKYYVETADSEKMLLRIADISNFNVKKKEYDFLKQLNRAELPIPAAIDFGVCEAGKSVYTLLSWMEGEEVEKVMPGLPEDKQYALGFKAGKILKEIHLNAPQAIERDWYERYFEVIHPRIAAYREEGIPFEGANEILEFIEMNQRLLHGRPQCGLHGDYHLGNLIIDEMENISVIDWQVGDFEESGDPWYEFLRINVEYPVFASGQIDGYFDNKVPEEFWKMFALYFSVSAITSIVWAKYYAPEELEDIMKLNRNIVEIFGGMKSFVPSWYRKIS